MEKYSKEYFKDLIRVEKERIDDILLPTRNDLSTFIKSTLTNLEECIKKAPYSQRKVYIIRFTRSEVCPEVVFDFRSPANQLTPFKSIFLDKDVHISTFRKCLEKICRIFKEDYDIVVTVSDEDLWIPLSQFEED